MTTTAAPQDQIIRLMRVSEDQRGLVWIKDSLQAAIALELSTIPPYLCGLWSIKNGDEAAELIRGIVIDEMFHMGLVCNMLSGIGGTPDIIAAAPVYPGPLPGGVRPQLCVYLSGLTRDYVHDVFMEIEMPEHPVASLVAGPPTIGAFYDALNAAFQAVRPPISMSNQLGPRNVGTNNILKPLENLLDVESAIALIKGQGEGNSTSPEAPQSGGEFAHYYKFGEIYHGRELRQVNGKWEFTGDVVPFPDVYPMGVVPAGGWPDPAEHVRDLLRTFNEAYTDILQDLEKAWAEGSNAVLGGSIGKMFALQSAAQELFETPLPGGEGSYGPDFRAVASGDPQ
ncbi:MAG: ferritin-like domain-containing protein [Pseudonocardiaceae bacterium]